MRVKLVFAAGQPAPLWLEVSDVESANTIKDVAQHVRKLTKLKAPVTLYLDGCPLRDDQSTSVLRDNDCLWVFGNGERAPQAYPTVVPFGGMQPSWNLQSLLSQAANPFAMPSFPAIAPMPSSTPKRRSSSTGIVTGSEAQCSEDADARESAAKRAKTTKQKKQKKQEKKQEQQDEQDAGQAADDKQHKKDKAKKKKDKTKDGKDKGKKSNKKTAKETTPDTLAQQSNKTSEHGTPSVQLAADTAASASSTAGAMDTTADSVADTSAAGDGDASEADTPQTGKRRRRRRGRRGRRGRGKKDQQEGEGDRDREEEGTKETAGDALGATPQKKTPARKTNSTAEVTPKRASGMASTPATPHAPSNTSAMAVPKPGTQAQATSASTPAMMVGAATHDGVGVGSDVGDYSAWPEVTGEPKQGDRLAIKVLEMSETYSPQVSDFKECEVVAIDPAANVISVRLAPHVPLAPQTNGKFDLTTHDDDGDGDDGGGDRVVEYFITSIHDMRMCPPSTN
ncbi:hypothetical protein PTSG_02187 [Salpingoeca rosetta]|uniref:Uncharacterized protein n=1 Tax=Salpingoeca rosetta (strain ATCC 50818 / BSB-021) TaxID=946362 RepID=F2U1G7_SALR5|nr:uncharacterized protein PTSG_02187 [Salpingoeca rosetta]EGD81469.1 hypothetical protein PTSG_02187 [Salpingoeca rosetta]|eukprot:XP_004996673.1 hypothetical protein PTSG_02187 [Salpingoeca rosetta]